MLLSRRILASLAIYLTGQAHARYLSNELSFGHGGKIAGDGHHDGIPGFKLTGEPNSKPEVLSNKVILTPPAPGGQRAAIWAEKSLDHTEWTTDIDFRASGPEHGGGKMQIWLVKNGQQDIGTSSIYTVGRFEGLALVLDSYGGAGGMLRGFLNDGSTSYKDHHHVDSLAFGHCKYAYRNLGRPSQIKIRQDLSDFKVEVDGKLCFESPKIKLPAGYFYGITAVSTYEPDSFEIFKLIVMTDVYIHGESAGQPAQQAQEPQKAQSSPSKEVPLFLRNNEMSDPKEISADKIEQSRQFADLHDRLQANFKHIATFQHDFATFEAKAAAANAELKEQMIAMAIRLEAIERAIQRIDTAVNDKDYIRLHNELKQTVKQTVEQSHTKMAEGLTGSMSHAITSAAPRLGFFIFVVLGFQMFLAVSYVIYKRRVAGASKKYL